MPPRLVFLANHIMAHGRASYEVFFTASSYKELPHNGQPSPHQGESHSSLKYPTTSASKQPSLGKQHRDSTGVHSVENE
jgi:hypothetical protein